MSILAKSTQQNLDIAIQNPQLLADYLKHTQQERWQRFHSMEARILVVDDNRRTSDKLLNGLYSLYGEEVESCNSPLEALEKIRSKCSRGRAYDLVLLDLHMPQMSGMQLMKELGANCPAIVINTASMMSPALADLCIQMDKFRANNIADLIHTHVMEKRPQDLPLAPIFIHLKDSDWKDLVDKIDSALLIKENIPNFSAAISSFLEAYQPKLVPITFTALSIHSLVEEIRNAINSIEPLINQLKKDYGLCQTKWWSSNHECLEAAIKDLKALRFTNINLENSETAFNHIHNIAGIFIDLGCSGLSFPESSQADSLVFCWREQHKEYNKLISELASGMRAYTSGAINLPSILQVITCNLGLSFNIFQYSQSSPELMTIEDSKYSVRVFLENLLKAYKDFSSSKSQDNNNVFSDLSIEFIPEGHRWNEDLVTRNALDKIDAGNYYALTFHCSHQEFEQIILKAKINGSLSELFSKKRVSWIPGSKDEQFFTLYIKASSKEISFSEYANKIEQEASNPSLVIDELGYSKNVPIYQRKNKDSQLTCIGELPCSIDYKTSQGKALQVPGIIFHFNSQYFFAVGNMHKDAAQLIADYINYQHSQKDAAFEQVNFLPSRNYIYEHGVRITFGLSECIQIEKLSNIRKSEQAKNVLLELGILDSRTAISDLFAPKISYHALEEESITIPKITRWQVEFENSTLADLKSCLGAKAESRNALETIQSYLDLITGPVFEEPTIIIRTQTAIEIEQQRELLSQLLNLLKSLRLSPRSLMDRADQVMIDGNCGRKTGLYLFNPESEDDGQEYSSCSFSGKLIPLINGSSPASLSNECIIFKNGTLLQKNSLIFGAGDHSLNQAKQQIALGLSLEILLQSLGISYEVCRGNPSEISAFYFFDGEQFDISLRENFLS